MDLFHDSIRTLRSIRSIRVAAVGVAVALASAALAPSARADDPAPLPPKPAPPSGRFFDTYDANQDGKVTKDEFTGDAEVFALLDKDGNGVVTLEELGLPADYKPNVLPKPTEEPMPDGKAAGLEERLRKFRAEIEAMDKDKDGRVSREEYTGKKIPFEYADRNKDGYLTMEDLRGGVGAGKGGKGAGKLVEEAMARFKESDKDGDGRIAKTEWIGAPDRFAQLDKDADGFVTREEFLASMRGGDGPPGGAFKGGKPGRTLERFDKNGDGKVTRDEFPGPDEAFREQDKNGDGAITPDEVPMGRPGKGAPGGDGMPPMPAPGGDGMMPPPNGGGGAGGEMPGAGAPPSGLFALLDKNHDGKISREEFPGSDDEWRAMDADHNGWITPAEAAGR
jgi:Ca2+-binding EF-hand superfamily protein